MGGTSEPGAVSEQAVAATIGRGVLVNMLLWSYHVSTDLYAHSVVSSGVWSDVRPVWVLTFDDPHAIGAGSVPLFDSEKIEALERSCGTRDPTLLQPRACLLIYLCTRYECSYSRFSKYEVTRLWMNNISGAGRTTQISRNMCMNFVGD